MEAKQKKPDRKVLWTLFKTCFVISCCTFGGGMVIISMLQKKFVEELHWIEQEEVMDMAAIAQSCPGVMAVNTSIIIGYHIAGAAGALLTVIGTVSPPMIILSVISVFYVQFRSSLVLSLILRGMQAGVAAVMINVAFTMIRNVRKDGDFLSLILLISASAASVCLGIDIILILLACGLAGGIYSIKQKNHRKELN